MADDLIILPTARKRGYSDDDMLYVIAWPLATFVQDDGLTMYARHDTAGRLMEVGTIVLKDGKTALAHSLQPPSLRVMQELTKVLGQPKPRGRK